MRWYSTAFAVTKSSRATSLLVYPRLTRAATSSSRSVRTCVSAVTLERRPLGRQVEPAAFDEGCRPRGGRRARWATLRCRIASRRRPAACSDRPDRLPELGVDERVRGLRIGEVALKVIAGGVRARREPGPSGRAASPADRDPGRPANAGACPYIGRAPVRASISRPTWMQVLIQAGRIHR